MADAPVEPASAINLIGASATVGALGAVVVWWAVAGRHPGGVVVGAILLVLAAGGIGAGLGRPRSRVRRGAVVGGIALVVAAVAIGALVVQARSVDVGGDRTVALDERVEAAWAQGDEIVAVTHDRVVAIADDGTTRSGSGLAVGDDVIVRAGAGGVATRDIGGEVVLRDAGGAEVWRVALTVDDRPAERTEVLAVDADGRAGIRACVGDRCDILGIDPDGAPSWRRPADGTVVGVGPVLIDTASPPGWREAPARLVVVDDPEGADPRTAEVELTTGEDIPLGDAGQPAVIGDVVTVARVLSDGCEVGIIRRGEVREETVAVPCLGDRFAEASPMGSVVVHRQGDGVVVVDVDTSEVALVEDVDVRTRLAGEGVLVEVGADGVRLRDALDDRALATFDPSWGFVASGPDGVVLERERESGNPFGPEELREVAVVDPASGEICARVRLDVPALSRAFPLPGCRAVLSPPDGPDVLVG